MADWLASMQQTFEYYTVDPGTWKDDRKLDTVKSCTITRDADSETRGSATFDVTDSLGECYIRVYLVVIQNGVTERFPLGTFLVQTPSSSFDGKIRSISMDAYTPLLELKEKLPPVGYALVGSEEENIMDKAYEMVNNNVRAPVVPANCDEVLDHNFVANADETWLSYITDLIATAKYEFDLDEMGRILFSPKQDTASLQPVWTYTDDNSSILYPDFSMDHDLYGVPNTVEVVYSNGLKTYEVTVTNDDPNSPISTVRRGRPIIYRDTNPDIVGSSKPETIKIRMKEYADQLLRDLSTLEYSVSYTHGYCPVRVGDCVRINYSRAGINGIKAKVVSQSVKCEPGCPVTEKAVFTTKLWG